MLAVLSHFEDWNPMIMIFPTVLYRFCTQKMERFRATPSPVMPRHRIFHLPRPKNVDDNICNPTTYVNVPNSGMEPPQNHHENHGDCYHLDQYGYTVC